MLSTWGELKTDVLTGKMRNRDGTLSEKTSALCIGGYQTLGQITNNLSLDQ